MTVLFFQHVKNVVAFPPISTVIKLLLAYNQCGVVWLFFLPERESSPATNYAAEFPTSEEIARVSTSECKGSAQPWGQPS